MNIAREIVMTAADCKVRETFTLVTYELEIIVCHEKMQTAVRCLGDFAEALLSAEAMVKIRNGSCIFSVNAENADDMRVLYAIKYAIAREIRSGN